MPVVPTEAMELGQTVEPLIVELFRRRFQVDVEYPGRSGRDGLWRWTIDAEVPAHDAILECKWRGLHMRKQYEADLPAMDVFLQTQFYAGIVGRKRIHVAVMFGGPPVEIYTYDFEPKVYADIRERCETWWRRHMEGGLAPEWVLSDGEQMLDKGLPQNPGSMDEEARELAWEMRDARLQEAEARRRIKELRLKLTLKTAGEHDALVAGSEAVRFVQSETTKIDYELAFQRLLSKVLEDDPKFEAAKLVRDCLKTSRRTTVHLDLDE